MIERDLSGLRAYADEVESRFETLRRNMTELERQLKAVAVSATSPDRLVKATVDARGHVVKLDLDPRIYRRPDSTELARIITETIHKAALKAADEVQGISERNAPGADAGSYLRGDVASRFKRFDFIEDQVRGGAD